MMSRMILLEVQITMRQNLDLSRSNTAGWSSEHPFDVITSIPDYSITHMLQD